MLIGGNCTAAGTYFIVRDRGGGAGAIFVTAEKNGRWDRAEIGRGIQPKVQPWLRPGFAVDVRKPRGKPGRLDTRLLKQNMIRVGDTFRCIDTIGTWE